MKNISLKDYRAMLNKFTISGFMNRISLNRLEKKLLRSRPCFDIINYYGMSSSERNWYLFDDLHTYLNNAHTQDELYNFLKDFIDNDKAHEKDENLNSIVLSFPEFSGVLAERFADRQDLLEDLVKRIGYIALPKIADNLHKPSEFNPRILRADLKTKITYDNYFIYTKFTENFSTVLKPCLEQTYTNDNGSADTLGKAMIQKCIKKPTATRFDNAEFLIAKSHGHLKLDDKDVILVL